MSDRWYSPGDAFVVGPAVLFVQEVTPAQTRIGIAAARSVPVRRAERCPCHHPDPRRCWQLRHGAGPDDRPCPCSCHFRAVVRPGAAAAGPERERSEMR